MITDSKRLYDAFAKKSGFRVCHPHSMSELEAAIIPVAASTVDVTAILEEVDPSLAAAPCHFRQGAGNGSSHTRT